MKQYKFSKTYIAAFMYRFAFLLFVPFLQGLLFAHQGIAKLLTLYGADLAVVITLLVVAVIRQSRAETLLSHSCLRVKSGAVIKTSDSFLLEKKICLTFTQPLTLRLFNACRLKISGGSSFATAYLSRKNCDEICRILSENNSRTYRSGIFRSLLMSLSFSNALTGLLAAVPVIRRVSALIGARQTALILEGASLEGLLSFTGLEPALSKISSLLFLAWVVGFSTEFFREYKLCFFAGKETSEVQKGLITKTRVVFRPEAVQAVVFNRSLLMFLLGLYSAWVCLNVRSVRKLHILSASSRSRCADLEAELLGKKPVKSRSISPPKSAMLSFTWLPLLCLFATAVILILYPEFNILKNIAAAFVPLCLLWFLFRIFALYTSSVTLWDGGCQVKFYKGLNLMRTVFRSSSVSSVEVRQSVFQRINGRCSVIFTLRGTKALKVRIKHLNKRKALDLLKDLYT